MRRSSWLVPIVLASAGCHSPPSTSPPMTVVVADAGSQAPLVESPSAAPSSSAPVEAGAVPEDDPFAASGCETTFPAAGTRFVEVMRHTLTLPKGRPATFMIADTDDTTRKAVVLLDVTGGAIERARVSEEGWAKENGQTRWATVERSDAGTVNATVNGPRGPLVTPASPADEAAVTTTRDPSRFVALASASIVGESPTVTVGAESRGPQTLEYPLTVRGKTGSAATGHGLYEQLDLKGRLVLRASDRAFVQLHLEGNDVMVEDSAVGDGRTRVKSPPVRGHVTFDMTRECFRPAGP